MFSACIISLTTAMPASPVPFKRKMFDEFRPPIASTGIETACVIAVSPSIPIGVEAFV